jgi:hypothetical protein
MSDDAERLLAGFITISRRTQVERLQAGRRRAAQCRLLAGAPWAGDAGRAGRDPRFLLQLHRTELDPEVFRVAEALLDGGWRGTYEDLVVVAAGIGCPAAEPDDRLQR